MCVVCISTENIIALHDTFDDIGFHYVVMEHGGVDMIHYLNRIEAKDGYLQWNRYALKLIKQIISAVKFIHHNNICHLDISLENLLVKRVPKKK